MKKPTVEFRIGLGSCGVASGGEAVHAVLERAAGARATVKTVGCNGMCHCEPMVEVVEPGGRSTLYGNVNAESARNIVRQHLRPRWLLAWWHNLLISERSLTVAAQIDAAQIDESAAPIRAATVRERLRSHCLGTSLRDGRPRLASTSIARSTGMRTTPFFGSTQA